MVENSPDPNASGHGGHSGPGRPVLPGCRNERFVNFASGRSISGDSWRTNQAGAVSEGRAVILAYRSIIRFILTHIKMNYIIEMFGQVSAGGHIQYPHKNQEYDYRTIYLSHHPVLKVIALDSGICQDKNSRR